MHNLHVRTAANRRKLNLGTKKKKKSIIAFEEYFLQYLLNERQSFTRANSTGSDKAA